MEICGDFTQWLGADMSIKIFMHLEDPSDLARVCSVSSSWHRFVISNSLCKQLCLKLMPEVACVSHVIEMNNMIEPVQVGQSNCMEWELLKMNHRVYALLARGLTPVLEKNCISKAISASSTDNYPEESIQNTLEPNDRVEYGASYWSSNGQSDPSVPERLLYKLITKLCLVTEIHVQPFQAFFQYGFPIYSSKAVRFKLGFPKFPQGSQNDATLNSAADHKSMEDNVIWTYTSPEYPMAQENCLQKFKLPEPVLCIGGILQVELLGRVQRQEMDGLFYICVTHVKVVGRPLLQPFDVEILYPSGKCTLKYSPERDSGMPSNESPKSETGAASRLRTLTMRLVEGWENVILSSLLGPALVEEDESDDESLA